MSINKFTLHTLSLGVAICVLAGCSAQPTVAPTATQTSAPTLTAAAPTASATPAEEKYGPIDTTICQSLQQTAAQALSVDFSLQASAPFTDVPSNETGHGCRLTAVGTGKEFKDPQSVLDELVKSVGLGWTEQISYEANGPTGADTGLTRDMGLMLIAVNWAPAAGVTCPTDQPIASCTLTPEQKAYTVEIDIAQYNTDFSLDGHWEDASQNFSLDLSQEWKNITGHHSAVAQNGGKIDALDDSISGSLQGKVATVQFKSSFTSAVGTAQITYVVVDTILWKIITPPTGEYYLPAEAKLTRK